LEVGSLKKTLSQVQSDRAEKELSLSQRIADMTASLDSLRHAEAEKSSAVALNDARILQLQAEKVSIDAALALKDARLVELEQVVHEHEASIVELRAEKALSSSLRTSLRDLDLAVKEHMNIFGMDLADTVFQYNESAHDQVAAYVAAVISELKRNGEETIAKQETVAESLGQVKSRLSAVIEEMQGESGVSSATMQATPPATSRSVAGIGLRVQDLYAHVGALELQGRSFRERLKSSKTAIAERDAELTKAAERVHALSSELQVKGTAIAALEEWKTQSMKITSERDQLRDDLKGVEETRANLTEELLASNATRDRLTIEISEREREVNGLRSALDDVETKRKRLEVTLMSAQEEQTAARNEFSSKIASLNATLASTQKDVERMESDLHAAHIEVQSLESHLTERLAERSHLQEMLEAEKIHVTELQKQHEDALVKMQEAEEDIADLRKSKEADEATIETLKKGFTNLRKVQMQSLAELENGVSV
jgi:chromosome segregation ATPase